MKLFISHSLDRIANQVKAIATEKDWDLISADSPREIQELLFKDKNISLAILHCKSCDKQYSLLTRIRRFNPDLILIIISDEWNLTDIRTAMNKGAFDILLSSIDNRSLKYTLNRAEQKIRDKNENAARRLRLERFQKELEIAAQIQMKILPAADSSAEKYELSAAMIPAEEVGGDFYDYFSLDEQRIGLVIGDVSGKGVPAAMFMAICRSLIKATAMQGWKPSECLGHVNRVLSEDNPSAMFVTIFYGILNTDNYKLDYCIGGHDSPILLKRDGEIKPLARTSNMVLGFDGEIDYISKSVQLSNGDKIFLYTDGITEAENPARKLFGRENLIKSLKKYNSHSPRKILTGILREIKLFTLGTHQSDDITAMTLGIKRISN